MIAGRDGSKDSSSREGGAPATQPQPALESRTPVRGRGRPPSGQCRNPVPTLGRLQPNAVCHTLPNEIHWTVNGQGTRGPSMTSRPGLFLPPPHAEAAVMPQER